jgi:hypothetical protein
LDQLNTLRGNVLSRDWHRIQSRLAYVLPLIGARKNEFDVTLNFGMGLGDMV